jgi:hypothetical protein
LVTKGASFCARPRGRRLLDFLERKRLAAERFEDGVVFLDAALELGGENLGLHQVDQAQAGAGGLVAVGGADAALGGADLVAALAQFALLVERAVIGQDEVRRFADEQAAGELDAALFEALDFPTSATGSMTTPLAMTHFLPARRMPEGMRCRTNFSGPISTVWPALLPPCERTTMSASSVRTSMILPFPSSPHWAPTRIVFGGFRLLQKLQRVAADVADGHTAVLGHFLDDLHEFLTAFGAQFREGDADDFALNDG